MKKPFPMVIVFDQPAAREQALRFPRHLLQIFSAEFDLETTFCSFDQIRDSRFSREANEVAAEARLIILATHDGRQLPPEVERWMESWMTPGKEKLFILLTPVENAGCSHLHERLQAALQSSPITYLAGRLETGSICPANIHNGE